MNQGDAAHELPPVQVRDVQPGDPGFGLVLALAAGVLAQDRYLTSSMPGALESRVLGAFYGTRCAGFLRYLIQVIGAEAGRPAVIRDGQPLTEGYVEPFGVDPQLRRAASAPRSSSTPRSSAGWPAAIRCDPAAR